MNRRSNNNTVLEVRDLVTRFDMPEGVVHAVNGVSFRLNQGETLGIVGESGAGKSVTVLSVMRLIPSPPGRIAHGQAIFNGKDLMRMQSRDLWRVRGVQAGFIFQDPMTSLNPVLTIGRQLTETLQVHLGYSSQQARDRAVELLHTVGIPLAASRLQDYPHQFSGGMRQRVMIAMALSCSPQLLIADEPTTALDVTVQAQILDLVKRLKNELNMAVIWITHDLGVVAGIADRVIVMYAGFIVEEAPVDELYRNPQHPYTRGLLGSLPQFNAQRRKLVSIKGTPPDMLAAARGCPFAPRCQYAFERCELENPLLRPLGDNHQVACWWEIDEQKPYESG